MHRFVLTLSLVALCALAQEKPQQAPQSSPAQPGRTLPTAGSTSTASSPQATAPVVSPAVGFPQHNADFGAGLPVSFASYFPGFELYDAGLNALGDFFQPAQGNVPARGQTEGSYVQPSVQSQPPSASASTAPQLPSAVPRSSDSSSAAPQQRSSPQTAPPTAPAAAQTAQGTAAGPQVATFQLGGLHAFDGYGGHPLLGGSIGTAPVQDFPAPAGGFYTGYLPGHGLFGPGF